MTVLKNTNSLCIFYLVIILATFGLIASLANGQLNLTPQIGKIVGNDDRNKYAVEVRAFFQKIENYIPSLSPSQREWLDTELKLSLEIANETNSWNRYLEITNSKEYKINYIKQTNIEIIKLLSLLRSFLGTQSEIYHAYPDTAQNALCACIGSAPGARMCRQGRRCIRLIWIHSIFCS